MLTVFARDAEGQCLNIEFNPEDNIWSRLDEGEGSDRTKWTIPAQSGVVLRKLSQERQSEMRKYRFLFWSRNFTCFDFLKASNSG